MKLYPRRPDPDPHMAIHVLEDDPGVSDSLALLLGDMGFEVFCHHDAEHFFRNPPPASSDIVLVDLALPGITGAEVIRWLQRLKDPPRIVAMSGQSQAVIDAELRGIGITQVMRKPLNQAAIAAHLARLSN